MSLTHLESNLNLAVVSFLLQCAASRSFDALEQVGMNVETLGEFIELTGEDMVLLAQIKDPIFRIEVDEDVWNRAKTRILKDSSWLRNALIKARAPRTLITTWWPMQAKAYAALRKAFNVGGSGRTRNATEEQEQRVWAAWSELTRTKTTEELVPADFLALYKNSGVDLDISWLLVTRWAAERKLGRKHLRSAGTL